MRRIGLALMVATPSMASAHATDTVLPHAAGSLRGALTESSQAFQQAHSTAVTQRYARLLDDLLRAGFAVGRACVAFRHSGVVRSQTVFAELLHER
jgi:hypothetical protein